MLAAEIVGQKLVDEGQVVVDLADLEDFLPPLAGMSVPALPCGVVVAGIVFVAEAAAIPAVLDVAVELDA